MAGRVGSVVLFAFAFGACRRDAPAPAAAATAGRPEGPQPANIVVTKERKDLVLSYLDPSGQYHDATRLEDVPEVSRAQVLVRDLTKSPDELHTADFLYVADLRAPGPDGRYPCGAVSRFGFEKGGAKDAARKAAEGTVEKGGALVTVYGAGWCGVCKTAKAWLKQRGVPYVERDVEQDPGASDELARRAAEAGLHPNGIPVIDVAGELMVGFDAQALGRLLEKKGLAKPP